MIVIIKIIIAFSTAQRLSGAQVLTSVADHLQSPSTAPSDWSQIYTIPSPAGEFREQRYDATITARHIAVFKSAADGVTLREVTVEGFSQDGKRNNCSQH